MPGGAHGEELAQRSELARGGDAADVRDVDAHKVDQAVAHEWEVLVDVDKELAHGDGDAGLLAHDAEVVDVLGREGVFIEEEVVRLEVLGELDGLDGWDALVDVVEEFG